MDASNLGQIIGRLMYADDAMPEKPAPKPRPDRAAQVLEFVSKQSKISCGDLVAALGISNGHAAVLLNAMHKAGQLVRTGEPYHYRYSLP